MKISNIAYSIVIVGSFLLLTSTIASADSGDNDTFETAEEIIEDSFSGSLVRGNDDNDWYVFEVPPFTDVKITVQLLGPSADDEISVISFLDSNRRDPSINITIDRSLNEDDDTFSNDDSGFIDLYLKVSGEGSYEIEYLFERDLSGGLCGSSIVAGLIPLMLIMILLIKVR